MANDLNVWTGTGRMTRDAETKHTQSGVSVTNFSIASNYSTGKGDERKEQASFFNCVAFGKTGEVIAQYAKKGDPIAVSGRLQQRSWESEGTKKSAVEIVVNEVKFLGGKKDAPAATDEIGF